MYQHFFEFTTSGRSTYEITDDINKLIQKNNIAIGLCHLFIQHTSASLIICENADNSVRRDIEKFMQKLAPDNIELYEHNNEGKDDMPAHLRTLITQTNLTIPISNNKLALGTWQGIFIWEHRLQKHKRCIVVTIQGD